MLGVFAFRMNQASSKVPIAAFGQMKRAVTIGSLCLILCSCSYVDCFRRSETLSVRVQSHLGTNCQMFQVTKRGEQAMTPTNGAFRVALPQLGYGYRELFGIVPIGQTNPERHERVILKCNGRIVHSVSVTSLRASPRDSDGAYLLRLE